MSDKFKKSLWFSGIVWIFSTNVLANEVSVYNPDGLLIGTYTTIQSGINACPERARYLFLLEFTRRLFVLIKESP